VLDVLGAQYVVSAIASSAPTRTDANATSAIGYRYAGAKVQAGGRGMLGFAIITTFDAAPVDGGWTITEQIYRQDFPFVGTPLQTDKWVMTGPITRGSAAIDACAGDPEAAGQDCFYDPADLADERHPALGPGGGLRRRDHRADVVPVGADADEPADRGRHPAADLPLRAAHARSRLRPKLRPAHAPRLRPVPVAQCVIRRVSAWHGGLFEVDMTRSDRRTCNRRSLRARGP
jgi:hypothetical protein